MTAEDALKLAEREFPRAPEKLVELVGIVVRRTPLNCDGWCLHREGKAIIRINSNAHAVRQRFTLAHEIGHLVLGIPTEIGGADYDALPSNKEEELVNTFAGELLLPLSIIKRFVLAVPVTPSAIKKLARRANVSEQFVARRLTTVSTEIGLKSGLIISYRDNEYQWHWPYTTSLNPLQAKSLLRFCLEDVTNLVAIPSHFQDESIMASVLVNPSSSVSTVFLQTVSKNRISLEADETLEEFIFSQKENFRSSLSGCFSGAKKKVIDLSLDEAVDFFNQEYLLLPTRWEDEFLNRLLSPKGQKYIRLRLKPWAKS